MTGPIEGADGRLRCPWAATPGPMMGYHDLEWGTPVTSERGLFERLTLEGFQAGLSWRTILNKRERFRDVFCDFEVDDVALYGEAEVAVLLQDAGIVRHRGKIEATIRNAQAIQRLRPEGGLAALVESYRPAVQPEPATVAELTSSCPESVALSKDLKKRGFSFVGPTTMYALMEATGMVNTHLVGCFRR